MTQFWNDTIGGAWAALARESRCITDINIQRREQSGLHSFFTVWGRTQRTQGFWDPDKLFIPALHLVLVFQRQVWRWQRWMMGITPPSHHRDTLLWPCLWGNSLACPRGPSCIIYERHVLCYWLLGVSINREQGPSHGLRFFTVILIDILSL